MNVDEIKELKKGIVLTAKYYGRDLPGEVVAMMADDLSDLEFSSVLSAYLAYRRDPKNRAMPLPAQIREIICPVVSPNAEARELVERIKFAITKFGYASGKLAHEYIGDIGWRSVQRSGGWHALCESDFLFNPSRQAQTRDSLIDQIQYGSKLGSSDIFGALPYDQQKQYAVEDQGSQKFIELDQEKSRQLKDFMEKFNLNAEKLKQGDQ